MHKITLIHPDDSVMIALTSLAKGETVTDGKVGVVVAQDVDKGAKIARTAMPAGAQVIKYGAPIGYLTQCVSAGEWVHTHNLKTGLKARQDYHYAPSFPAVVTPCRPREINVYSRASGDIGIRNELWILPTVGCVNAIAQTVAQRFRAEHALDDIDGIQVFTHPYGCSQLGDDHENTRRILADMVVHPNAGGVLVIGLGCENNQIEAFKALVGEVDPGRVRFMVAQHEQDELAVGLRHLNEIYQVMRQDRRQPAPIGRLRVGLECGGSDGLSGITANPMLGRFSDYLILNGCSSVLTEVPEMFGAEHLLFSRCENETVFRQAVKMINDFKRYFIEHHQPVYENPSPGNKKGGISTLEDKSLGCTQKAGASKVVDVLEYGQRLTRAGLSLLSAPGNDAVATSALGAAGCHMVLFSTGRGTPYGGFVPTVKIATNSELAAWKPHWIDFNAGALLEGKDADTLLEEFVALIAEIASGKPSRNEINHFRELAIFKTGVTL
ncbi:UxaA family hydrolase [Brenneria corticis]|uniref:Altronate hydrolase n=1 Tax=Brenneria corticis TaxID=2173106 RepID=A0A2U1UDB4_9GAMM|nr:altronate dehydratase family protein [Brenneria sp. CFCC 11842]PWC19661.1 altronate hydrolase [Brenneria sp. CFCC 11842]